MKSLMGNINNLSNQENFLYKRNSAVSWDEIDGQVLIVNGAFAKAHELNEVAAFIWKELDSAKLFSQLVEAVCNAFDIEEVVVKLDLNELLVMMLEHELIINSN